MSLLRFTGAAGLLLIIAAACDDDGTGIDPDPDTGIELRMVAEGLTNPVTLAEAPDGTGRLFIVEQTGLVRVLTADGTLLEEPFLDVRDRLVDLMPGYDERGLLGFAFHPQFASNGRFFVYYTAPPRVADYDNTSVVAEFQVEPGDAEAVPTFIGEILSEDQPQFNHEGGTIAFGPDGYLYISIGDGGGRDDEGPGHVSDWYENNAGGNAQDIEQNLLGSILRIDVSNSGSYTIPSDNPFVGEAGLDEIYAYGFRNPYRFSFDMGGSQFLIVGDAGQDMWEEVHVVESGGNYGWNVMEGAHCFDAEEPMTIPASCPTTDPTTGIALSLPVIEMPNYGNPTVGSGEGIVTIVGGNVYRGDDLPELQGRYIFGAFTTGELEAGPAGAIYVAQQTGASTVWPVAALELAGAADGVLGQFVLGFGQDLDGEVYVLTTETAGPSGETGKVFRLARSSTP